MGLVHPLSIQRYIAMKSMITAGLLIPALSLVVGATSSFAAKKCSYTVSSKDTRVRWTGYKTPAKAGVSGGFSHISITGIKPATKARDALVGTKFAIKSASASSGDQVRDVRIYTLLLGGAEAMIKGEFAGIKNKHMLFKVTLNGVTRVVPMSYTIEEGANKASVKGTGYIDLIDFSLGSKLAEFNKACFVKHEGKSWSDVKIKFELGLDKACR